ncbi:hypothetical protein G6F62_015642 [Rhizopus arrhizus]|nr:hypothetical protein G6F62_015642 [Rhizopus arrhizus]
MQVHHRYSVRRAALLDVQGVQIAHRQGELAVGLDGRVQDAHDGCLTSRACQHTSRRGSRYAGVAPDRRMAVGFQATAAWQSWGRARRKPRADTSSRGDPASRAAPA